MHYSIYHIYHVIRHAIMVIQGDAIAIAWKNASEAPVLRPLHGLGWSSWRNSKTYSKT